MAGNSESNKRSAKTKVEKYGEDYHKKAASKAAQASHRGYFGYLKENNPLLLSKIGRKGAEERIAKDPRIWEKYAGKV
jgi:hypothetical protein